MRKPRSAMQKLRAALDGIRLRAADDRRIMRAVRAVLKERAEAAVEAADSTDISMNGDYGRWRIAIRAAVIRGRT